MRKIAMQTWFPQVSGGLGIKWRVAASALSLKPAPVEVVRQPQLASSPSSLLCERRLAGTARKDDTNHYLKRTGWVKTFNARPYWHAMRQLTYQARASYSLQLSDPADTDGYLDGVFIGQEVEGTPQIILQHMDKVFLRLEETFHTTPVALRTWLYSYSTTTFAPYTLTWLENKATLHRCLRHWKRLLCCLFRAGPVEVEEEVLALSPE